MSKFSLIEFGIAFEEFMKKIVDMCSESNIKSVIIDFNSVKEVSEQIVLFLIEMAHPHSAERKATTYRSGRATHSALANHDGAASTSQAKGGSRDHRQSRISG